MNNNVAQASAIIMKMVYDDKFVQMLDQMLSQTKGGKGTENGIDCELDLCKSGRCYCTNFGCFISIVVNEVMVVVH